MNEKYVSNIYDIPLSALYNSDFPNLLAAGRIISAPDYDDFERQVPPWHSGELAGYYQDWYFHKCDEVIFDCESGGIPHRHCMDILIAEKPDENGYAGPLAGRK